MMSKHMFYQNKKQETMEIEPHSPIKKPGQPAARHFIPLEWSDENQAVVARSDGFEIQALEDPSRDALLTRSESITTSPGLAVDVSFTDLGGGGSKEAVCWQPLILNELELSVFKLEDLTVPYPQIKYNEHLGSRCPISYLFQPWQQKPIGLCGWYTVRQLPMNKYCSFTLGSKVRMAIRFFDKACTQSITEVMGQRICSGEIIFDENFESDKLKKWQTVVRFGGEYHERSRDAIVSGSVIRSPVAGSCRKSEMLQLDEVAVTTAEAQTIDSVRRRLNGWRVPNTPWLNDSKGVQVATVEISEKVRRLLRSLTTKHRRLPSSALMTMWAKFRRRRGVWGDISGDVVTAVVLVPA
ncbi:hypothetical protein AAG570_002146 [Ranatra chinensis]|uniref:Uncharacterized protein n=1 Tax=Ranatra chinensis TaxID=642074 RepID=A0ABD0YPG7_9HEMI